MHCKACDTTLNDFELSRTYEDGVTVDLCNTCYSYIEDDIDTSADMSLMSESDTVLRNDEALSYYEQYLDSDIGIYDDRET